MLYMMGGGRITRVHGPFVADKEVEEVVAQLKSQGAPEYLSAVTIDADAESAEGGDGGLSTAAKNRTTSTTRPSPSSSATARPRPATSSAALASATTRLPRSSRRWSRKRRRPANHPGKRDILVPEDEEAAFR